MKDGHCLQSCCHVDRRASDQKQGKCTMNMQSVACNSTCKQLIVKLVIAKVGQDNDACVRPVSVQLSCKVRPALMANV